MPVSTTHPEYDKHLPEWQSTRDAVEGQSAIKCRRETYLPEFIPYDLDRYNQYIARALYVNFTARTLNGLIGMIFRKAPQYDLPSEIEPLIENANYGQSLEQLAKEVSQEVMQVGRCGILTDYPQAQPGLSAEDTAGITAKLLLYRAESIVNWHYSNGKLLYVVLKECAELPTNGDPFVMQSVIIYRVCHFDESGNYMQTVYDEQGRVIESLPQRDVTGSPWLEIPFVFIGAQANGPTCNKAPLYDLAQVNIAHYRNSADYEEGVFIHGQGTLFISSSMSADQFKTSNPNGIQVGSRSGHFLGDNGNATLVQMAPNSAAFEAMNSKEAQMLAIGARLIQPINGSETVDGARLRAGAEVSVLSVSVGNISEGIEQALEYACGFMGGDPDAVEYKLNEDFFDASMTAQEIMSMIQLADRGDIAQTDIRAKLRELGWIDPARTDDDIDSEAETSGAGLLA